MYVFHKMRWQVKVKLHFPVFFMCAVMLCSIIITSVFSSVYAQNREADKGNFARVIPSNEWYSKSMLGMLIERQVGDPDLFAELVRRGGIEWFTGAIDLGGRVLYHSNIPAVTVQPNLRMDYMKFYSDMAKKHNIRFLGGYYGFRNPEAVKKHPEWAVVKADGSKIDNLVCPNSQFPEELMLPQIREVYERYKPDGYWFDCDNWIVGQCYCENCLKMFKEQYGFDAPRDPDDPGYSKYTEFRRKSFTRYSKKVGDLIHELNLEATYVTNWGYTFLQPEPVPDFVDFLSSDIGCARRTEMVSLLAHYLDAEPTPWDIMISNWITGSGVWNNTDFRPKSPDYLLQEHAVIASHGGKAHIWSSYDRKEGPVSPYDIMLNEHLANFYHSRKSVFLGTEPVRCVAVLHSASTFYNDGDGFFHHGKVLDRISGANLALRQNHTHFHILNEEYLLENLDDYKVVLLSNQTYLSAGLVSSLRRWVDRGGNLIVTGLTAVNPSPGGKRVTPLKDVLGLQFTGTDVINPGIIRIESIPFHATVKTPFYPVQLTGARTILPLMKDWDAYNKETLPYPAITSNKFGKGNAIYIAADIFSRYLHFQYPGILNILDEVMRIADPFPHIETDAPKFITFVLRKKGSDMITHLVNEGADWDMKMSGAFLIENVPVTGPVSVKIRCDKKPADVIGIPEIENIQWRWDNDGVWVNLPRIHIHQALVLKDVY